MKAPFLTLVALFAIIRSTFAALNIHNWCSESIYFWVSTNGSANSDALAIAPSATFTHQYIILPATTSATGGTSIKLSFDPSSSSVLQFEYTPSLAQSLLYYDLSDLDGNGASQDGSPFYQYNVELTPMSQGANIESCLGVKCASGQLCKGAYNTPSQVATLVCLLGTGKEIELDLNICVPDGSF